MDVRDAALKDHQQQYAGDHSDFAVNSEYVASQSPNGIVIRKISASQLDQYTIRYHSRQPRCRPVLTFSLLRLNLLAAANGPQVLIFDVEKKRARHVLKGNGRVVTCIAWAQDDPRTLATGTADGAVCIWSLKASPRPMYQLRYIHSPCYAVAFKSDDWRCFAASHEGSVSTWSVAHDRPVAISRRRSWRPKVFRWAHSSRGTILSVSPDGDVELLTVANALEPPSLTRLASIHEGLENDEAPWYHTDAVGVSLQAAFEVGYKIRQASAFGRRGLVVLPCQSTTLYFYAYPTDQGELIELWRLHANVLIDNFATLSRSNGASVVVSYETSAHSHNVPLQVLDGMGWEAERKTHPRTAVRDAAVKPYGIARGAMKAEPCRRVKTVASPSFMLSPMPEGVRKTSVKAKKKVPKTPITVEESEPETSASRAMTSGLEPPKETYTDEEENDPPMPFPSPSITARKVSPVPLLASLDESIHLPPPRASFDSISTMATNDNDSDSDDETFGADMQGSSSYLPGGVNVPLPRSCGAAFAANGQLLTIFPEGYEDEVDLRPQHSEIHPSESHDIGATKLFPSFGNLASSSPGRDSVLDSDNGFSTGQNEHVVPQFAIQPSSFDSRPSWRLKTSPIKATSARALNGGTVNISVHDLEEFMPTRRSLAAKYRTLQYDTENIGDVCRENASSAEAHNLFTTAAIWRRLALLLDSTAGHRSSAEQSSYTPLSLMVHDGFDASANDSIARASPRLPRDTPDLVTFSHHALGKAWAIGRLFAQAESLASVQLLALMSTVLSRAFERQLYTFSQPQPAPATRSPMKTKRCPNNEVASIDSTRYSGIPILQANSTGTGYSTESPRKRHGSQNSSRNPSHLGTPYIGSSNSTPPLTLPPLPRQNSRLTASGSVSPDHHRSSFSIAAKNYAASIAEKLSSHGSLPPTKRLGTSPGNELSTSLPDRSTGSWSKTVSFASNLGAVKKDQRSLSLAQEDDNCDSDRTVDDSSLPHTPKQSDIGVVFKTKNDMFFGEEALPAPEPFMSEELALKGHYWRQCYAEQLRSWEMLLEATELENIGNFPDSLEKAAGPLSEDAVVPIAASGRPFVECSICFCFVQAAEQLCPACLHVMHPACLEEITATIASTDDFTCPTTGCGCRCGAVDMEALDFATLNENENESVGGGDDTGYTARQKPSLTDPFRPRQFDYSRDDSW